MYTAQKGGSTLSVIVLDRSHNNEVQAFVDRNNGFSKLASYIKEQGMNLVECTGNLHQLIDRLKENDVLWLIYPKVKYTSTEKKAIVDFAKKGGNLFITAEWGNIYENAAILNDLLEDLGSDIHFNFDRVSDERNGLKRKTYFMGEVMDEKKSPQFLEIGDLKNHRVTAGVNKIYYFSGCSLNCPDNKAIGRTAPSAFSDRDANRKMDGGEEFGTFTVIAWDIVENGRIIALGDSSTATNEFIDEADNKRFVLNTLSWLSRKN